MRNVCHAVECNQTVCEVGIQERLVQKGDKCCPCNAEKHTFAVRIRDRKEYERLCRLGCAADSRVLAERCRNNPLEVAHAERCVGKNPQTKQERAAEHLLGGGCGLGSVEIVIEKIEPENF